MYLAHLNWQQAKRAFAKDDLVELFLVEVQNNMVL